MLRKTTMVIFLVSAMALAGGAGMMTISTPKAETPQTALPAQPARMPQNSLEQSIWFHAGYQGKGEQLGVQPSQGGTDQPPFGTVVAQWNLGMSGMYSGAGITWRQDSGRFYLIDQGAYSMRLGLYSFRPENPTGTLRRDSAVFANLGSSTQDIPWGIAWDPDSGCFWITQILDGSVYAGCYLLRMVYNGNVLQWRGTPADSWRIDAIMSTYWMGGMVKKRATGYFYGTPVAASANQVCKFNPYTKTFIGRVPNGASISERGCTFIPYDSLYLLTCGWNEDYMRKRDTMGTLLQQVYNTIGLADWDVWIPQSINVTDTVYAFLMTSSSANTLLKVSLGMLWGELPQAMPHDVGPQAILQPASCLITPGVPITPTVRLKNYSNLYREYSIPAGFIVESLGVQIYSQAVLIDSLNPQETLTVTFTPDWVPGGALWSSYMIKAYTAMTGDLNPNNDTMRLMGLVSTDTIVSPSGATAPSIDGYLNFSGGEWNDAYFANISNVAGWGAVPPQPHGPDAAYAWFKHDNSYLYLAFAFREGMARNIEDQVGFYLDENGDGQWASDNSEGNYWFWINGSGNDEVLFRWHRPDTYGLPNPVPGAQMASGTFNGYLVFEVRVPFGTLPYQINMNTANDTGRLFIYMMDDYTLYGWWPVGMDEDSWRLPSNYGTFILQTQQTGDVGVKAIVQPGTSVLPGATITPTGTWKNYGTTSMNFTAYFFMDSAGTRVYSPPGVPYSLAGGAEANITFPDYTFANDTSSGWVAKCSTAAAGDVNAANNVLTKSFKVSTVPPVMGWKEMKSLPGTPSGKQVKDGGWLAFDPGLDGGLIYAAKGNKTSDFYRYYVADDSWQTLAPIKEGTETKLPSKGCVGAADGQGVVYMTKGSNTLGFWKYYAVGDSWLQAEDVPLGASGKKVKGGTDMVYAVVNDTGYVYLLKGYKTEFYRYNTVTKQWETLQDAPAGAKAKWDKGSWLVYDGDHYLYAHKAKYHELWRYDLSTGAWDPTMLKGMPLSGMLGKTKKSKDGGCGAYYDGAIYALKGGNTQEFWCYFVDGDSWKELDTMPAYGSTGKKKRVKAGGDIVAVGASKFFAFKGNKTLEFWQYGAATLAAQPPVHQGVMVENVVAGKLGITVTPNPLAKGLATVRYSLPQAGPVRLVIYDVTGRDVVHRAFVAGRSGAATLDLRNLASGVYLVKLDASGYSATHKLTVQH